MKLRNLCWFTAAAIVFLSASAWAGGTTRIGTAGAQELRIPIGARSTALGGSAVADVSGVEALFWNPAGAAVTQGTEAVFSYMKYIAGINLGHAGVTTNLGDFGSLGASVKVLSIGDIEVTREDSPNEDNTTGEIFSPSFAVIGLTYARRMTDRVSFGITGMYISESIMRESASGIAFDFGFLYDVGWSGLKFGGVMKNYGPNMKFDGPDFEKVLTDPDFDPQAPGKAVKTESASFDLPSYVQMGVCWSPYNANNNRVSLLGTFQSNNFSPDEYKMGAEYALKDMLFLRAGYSSDFRDELGKAESKTSLRGLTLGAGIKTKVGRTEIGLDYSWMQSKFFDNNQLFSLGFSF
jgi:hypothetical protein